MSQWTSKVYIIDFNAKAPLYRLFYIPMMNDVRLQREKEPGA